MPIRREQRDDGLVFYEQKQAHLKLGRYDIYKELYSFVNGSLPIGRSDAFSRRERQRMGPLTSLWTGSDATFDLAKEWLRKCINSHKECNLAYNSASVLPSRLLQVNISTSGLSIRLCDREHIRLTSENTRLPYIALSHRWPKEPIICLSRDNEGLFMRGIPVDSLPKTYEDAAQTTWRLGYEYLWIDSLCILQDCSLDWERESAIMGDIYRGSVMTIATLSAGSKSDGGFFTIRNPLKYVPCSLLTREDNYHIFKKPRMSSNHFAIGPNFAEEERHPVGELLSRGWVVQERVLSPRTLYFEPRSIIWECNYCYTIPEFPEMTFLGSMQISYSPKQAFSLLSLESLPDLKNPTEKFLTFHASWSRLLGSYTKCHLTMASDKLVAVNGMIRKIEASSGMHAIAGLFLEILPLELLWFSVQNAEVALPPGPYRAPSWSWASLDVLVKSNYVELVRKYKFSFDWKLQVVSHVADAKPNGQLASAHIVVEGALREINWPSHHQRTRRLRPFPIQESNKKFEHRDHWVADCTDVYSGNIWALHVAHGTGAFFIARDPECSVFEDGMCDVGILLKKLDGEDGIFRRVGYFEQRYWALDTHPIFAPALAINTRRIKLV